MKVVDEIKSRLDILDIVGPAVQLKKAGRIYKGLCPFHTEKTPSFIVYPEQGTWHCFGACGTGGDIFTFVMKKDNLEFGDALRLLADRAGVELHAEHDGEENKNLLLEIHRVTADYYHYLLLNHPSAEFAREYLQRRLINRESVEQFELGFALQSQASLKDHLESKGFAARDIERAGLVLPVDVTGGHRDRFRGRLLFPIRNRRGQTIGFGGRSLSDEDQPKYLNSPETPLFSKGDVLYGLDLAKDAIRQQDLAVVVEGYTDVIVAHQEGFKNVVAAMGTALTERQLSLLKRLTKRYALALDADVAGAAATERGLELARTALSRKQVPVPVGPGMMGFEERLDAELLIISLPEGKDPDEVILQNKEHWRNLVEQATPLVDYYFDAQTRELDLRSAHGKTEAVRRLLPIVAEINDPVLRAHYTQQLARLVQVDERSLAQQLKPRAGASRQKVAEATSATVPVSSGAKYDEQLLSLALGQPGLISRVKFISVDDFAYGWAREIWQALTSESAASAQFEEEELIQGLSQPSREQAVRLMQLAKEFELTEPEAEREIEAAAYRLRLQRDKEELTQMQFALADATPEEESLLHRRADLLRRRMAEAQRALNMRTVLRNAPPPTWTHESLT